jgi:hypothetical protein
MMFFPHRGASGATSSPKRADDNARSFKRALSKAKLSSASSKNSRTEDRSGGTDLVTAGFGDGRDVPALVVQHQDDHSQQRYTRDSSDEGDAVPSNSRCDTVIANIAGALGGAIAHVAHLPRVGFDDQHLSSPAGTAPAAAAGTLLTLLG